LGFAQPKIHTSRAQIQTNRKPRKAFPATLKTLGHRIQAARFEKRLCQREVAEQLGVTTALVNLWQQDEQTPTDD